MPARLLLISIYMQQAYCVKCKAKKDMADAKKVEMKNGRPAMKGKCADCGCGMYCILGKAEGAAANNNKHFEQKKAA